MQFGIIGSGSWATALVKLLTDNKHTVGWCVRSPKIVKHLQQRHHNPSYLSSVYFDTGLLNLETEVANTIAQNDHILVAVPSAYIKETLQSLDKNAFAGKKVISAVKGILPEDNLLLNEYLLKEFELPLTDYFTIMGP